MRDEFPRLRCPLDGTELPVGSAAGSVVDHFCPSCQYPYRVWRGPVLRRQSKAVALTRQTAKVIGVYERRYAVELGGPYGPVTFEWSTEGKEEVVEIRQKADAAIVQVATNYGEFVCGAAVAWPGNAATWPPPEPRSRAPMAAAIGGGLGAGVHILSSGLSKAAILWGAAAGLGAFLLALRSERQLPGQFTPLPSLPPPLPGP